MPPTWREHDPQTSQLPELTCRTNHPLLSSPRARPTWQVPRIGSPPSPPSPIARHIFMHHFNTCPIVYLFVIWNVFYFRARRYLLPVGPIQWNKKPRQSLIHIWKKKKSFFRNRVKNCFRVSKKSLIFTIYKRWIRNLNFYKYK